MKLDLTDSEKKALRKEKVKQSEVVNYSLKEIKKVLSVSESRAKEIFGLADFQQIPSIGIKFAKDLLFLGYHSIDELKSKKGAELLNDYEQKRGYKIDPCVEDQFRLVVDFAKNRDKSKNWWDFTSERKEYRKKNGYPKDRPTMNWTEAYGIN